MPKPRPNETKDDYIGRCIGVLISEGKDKNQAAAICNSMWDEKDKMSAYKRALKDFQDRNEDI